MGSFGGELAALGIHRHSGPGDSRKDRRVFKSQMRDKIEIEEAARGQRRRVNAGVDFRHAPAISSCLAIRAPTTPIPCARS